MMTSVTKKHELEQSEKHTGGGGLGQKGILHSSEQRPAD